MIKIKLNKAYIGKNSCFKIQLTKNNESYLHTGKKQNDKWVWEKAKFNDLELTKLFIFLGSKEKTIKFFHNFEKQGTKTSKQIYFNRDEKGFIFPIINKLSGKSLCFEESINFKIILSKAIQEMAFN